jgi:hypothetical protein
MPGNAVAHSPAAVACTGGAYVRQCIHKAAAHGGLHTAAGCLNKGLRQQHAHKLLISIAQHYHACTHEQRRLQGAADS